MAKTKQTVVFLALIFHWFSFTRSRGGTQHWPEQLPLLSSAASGDKNRESKTQAHKQHITDTHTNTHTHTGGKVPETVDSVCQGPSSHWIGHTASHGFLHHAIMHHPPHPNPNTHAHVTQGRSTYGKQPLASSIMRLR